MNFNAAITILFIYWTLIIVLIIGHIINIVKFVGMLGGEITMLFVARALGLFAPGLGAIMGYFF